MKAFRSVLIAAALSLGLAGCASVPTDPAARAAFKANNDPLEPLNRDTFAFNLFVDRVLIKPLAQGYKAVLPEPIREALRHFLDNLHEPVVLANDLLQGRLKSAGQTGLRFALNTTVGFGGIDDVATGFKLPKKTGDFGQTLWAWGLPEGPYLILPVVGPSSPRDGIGMWVDIYIDPFRYVAGRQNYPSAVSVGRFAADGIDLRSRNIEAIDVMQKEAVDYYASFRSLFRQNRAAMINSEKPSAMLPSTDFYADPGH
jgi:phospholipid-binding lipoprotein MlaA